MQNVEFEMGTGTILDTGYSFTHHPSIDTLGKPAGNIAQAFLADLMRNRIFFVYYVDVRLREQLIRASPPLNRNNRVVHTVCYEDTLVLKVPLKL